MRKIITAALAASAISFTIPVAAQAQAGWMNINQRQAALDRRIDRGVRDGSLTRAEAVRLRSEFRQIAYLESRYRRTGGGLSQWERRDLDARFDRLAMRIRLERSDWDNRGYRGYRR